MGRSREAKKYQKKLELVLFKGGKCEDCGYCKNLSALDFHHKNPKKKKFLINSTTILRKTMKELVKEAKKCRLLCSNCHREFHHPKWNNEPVQ